MRAHNNSHMKESSPKHQSRFIVHATIAIGFALLLAAVIYHFSEVEPDYKGAVLEKFGVQMENSAIHAHWKWKAEDKPERIMLIHYDKSGSETARRPVTMFHTGWPKVEPANKGCEKLWRTLLAQPMVIDGFKVYGEYYSGEADENGDANPVCRFRLSSGRYFDYFVARGAVTLDSQTD